MYSLVCICSMCVCVYVCVIHFLIAENFTYKELSYLTISLIQNKAKNLLKANKRSPDRGDQSLLTTSHVFKYRTKSHRPSIRILPFLFSYKFHNLPRGYKARRGCWDQL